MEFQDRRLVAELIAAQKEQGDNKPLIPLAHKNPLGLYDCFLPRLKDYLRSKTEYALRHLQRRSELRQDANAWSRTERTALREEIAELKAKCTQLEEETVVVKWYIEIMEGGVDTKQMMKYYYSAKDRIDKLAVAHARALAAADDEQTRLRKKLSTTEKQLKKLFNNCLKPLMAEVKLKDEIIDRWNKAKAGANDDLKMLNAIIRIPRLCDEFQKACRKKQTAETIRKSQ